MDILPFFLLILSMAGLGEQCDVGWVSFQSHCYRWFPLQAETNINKANYLCRELGADLLIINNQEEEDFIEQQLNLTMWVYLGCTDNEQEGYWKTFAGDDVVWENWMTSMSQPNNQAGVGDEDQENCMARTVPSGQWADLPCNSTAFPVTPDAVCEMPSEQRHTDRQHFLVKAESYLIDYNYKNATVVSIFDCTRACLKEFPKCVAVNYRKEAGNENCVLNFGSHKEANYKLLPNSFRPNPFDLRGWVYVYLKKY